MPENNIQLPQVLKIGGSMLSKSSDLLIDFSYLRKLDTTVRNLVSKSKLSVVIGGGYLAREAQMQAKELGGIYREDDLHRIGRTAIVFNAEVVRAFWSDIAEKEIFKFEDFHKDTPIEINKGLLVGSAGRPGTSSDMGALTTVLRMGGKRVISLKNVDGVYTSDPSKDVNAQKLTSLSWEKYLEIIGNPETFDPGGHYPVDPITSRLARDKGAEFAIIDGNDIESIANAFLGKPFNGSLISDFIS